MGLIDFDEFGYGWRAYDISTFFWSVCPLSDAELQALPCFVVLRHIWAGGTGVRFFATDVGVKQIVHVFEPALQFIKDWMAGYG